MLSAKWMNLVLILGLINYSYEYNRRKEQTRRRTRDTELQDAAEEKIAGVMADSELLEKEVKKDIEKNEKLMDELTDAIKKDVSEMVDMAVHEITTIHKWTTVQQKIHTGFTMIIDSYRTFIKLQRGTCERLETFANDIISKYQIELDDINGLTPPTLSTGGIDTSNPLFERFRDKWSNMLEYFNYHGSTLRTAFDCPNDLSRSVCQMQSNIINPVTTRTMVVPVIRSVVVQPQPNVIVQQQPNVVVQRILSVPQQPQQEILLQRGLDVPLPCGEPEEYNGYQTCPNAILAQSRRYINDMCMRCSKK